MLYTVLAYLIWGSFAAFFPLLKPAAPLEILAHRVVWTAVFMLILIVATKAIRELRAAYVVEYWRGVDNYCGELAAVCGGGELGARVGCSVRLFY